MRTGNTVDLKKKYINIPMNMLTHTCIQWWCLTLGCWQWTLGSCGLLGGDSLV